jgi:hypothetical protein
MRAAQLPNTAPSRAKSAATAASSLSRDGSEPRRARFSRTDMVFLDGETVGVHAVGHLFNHRRNRYRCQREAP